MDEAVGGLTVERGGLHLSTQAPAIGQFNDTRETLSYSIVRASAKEDEVAAEDEAVGEMK